MKRILLFAASILMAAALGACTPTTAGIPGVTGEQHIEHNDHETDPEGNVYETVDGVAEKQGIMQDDDGDNVTVLIYTLKDDGTGLAQTIDSIPGTEMDAQKIIDLMAEMGVLEDGITVESFENKEGALSLNLSSLEKKDDPFIITSLGNTFISNYEAESIALSVAGEPVAKEPLVFNKNYKQMK